MRQRCRKPPEHLRQLQARGTKNAAMTQTSRASTDQSPDEAITGGPSISEEGIDNM
jgi:hypothetical protein